MSASSPPLDAMTGWRYPRTQPSLPESNASVRVPRSGPLAGGARFGYTLLSVILLSNLMAILLQSLALKLGIVTRSRR